MAGAGPIADFRAQLQALQRDAESVSASLRDSVVKLASGTPIDDRLLLELRDVSTRVADFRQDLRIFGAERSLVPPDISLDSASFNDLSELLRQFECSAANRLQAVLSKLETVQRLQVLNDQRRTDFAVVFDEAARLRELALAQDALTLPQELHELETGKHRLARLIRFLELQQNPAALNPDEIDAVEAEIENAFDKRFRQLASLLLRLPQDISPGARVPEEVIPAAGTEQPEPAAQCPDPPESVTAARPSEETQRPPPAEVPAFLAHTPRRRSWRRLWWAALMIAMGAGLFAFKADWITGITHLWRRPSLSLKAYDLDGQVQIHWDRAAKPIRSAAGGTLEITDGAMRTVMALDSGLLKSGAVSYARQTARVDVRLAVQERDGKKVEEFASSLRRAPATDHKPVESVQAMDGKLDGTAVIGGPGRGEVFNLDTGLPKAPPSVAQMVPASGAAGQQILLWGSHLLGATLVTFNGVPAAAFKVNSTQAVIATVPPGATTGPVTIATASGTFTTKQNFSVQ